MKIRNYLDEAIRRIKSAFQLRGTKHGKGNYVFGSIRITERAKLVVGSYCRMNYGSYINASNGIKMGDDVTLSANCSILTTGLDYNTWIRGERKHISTEGGVTIGNHVWIGANAIILPGVKITGEYVVIGAGAIVTRNITEGYCVYAGNPARKIKELSESGFATADK